MCPKYSILESLSEQVVFKNPGFHLRPGKGDGIEILPKTKILLSIIQAADRAWPYDVDPSPRALGSLIELLRGCRFYAGEEGRKQIIIIPDRASSRAVGAYDTPQPIVDYLTESAVVPVCGTKIPPVVYDLACGAGYFLIKALEILVAKYPSLDPLEIVRSYIRGIDIDTVAVHLTKRNFRRVLLENYGRRCDESSIAHVARKADSLCAKEDLPFVTGSIDTVIGNPPYRFLSGRDSPIAALRAKGEIENSVRLRKAVRILAERFPESSAGCKDQYKWFVDRASECLRPGGYLGYVVPNTWLMYPRYRDLRTLLQARGTIKEVLDLGQHPFKRACVPVATLVWKKTKSKGIYSFILSKPSREFWQSVELGDKALGNPPKSTRSRARINSDGDIVLNRPSFPKATDDLSRSSHFVRLGDLVTLREGSHAIRAIGLDVRRKPSGLFKLPVIIDKTMAPLRPPEIGFVQAPDKRVDMLAHSGERFFIRKTGDRIIASPSPTSDFAMAHQNVYVGKIVPDTISMYALLGILNSTFLSTIYRESPGGQQGRPHAQLRILFLNQLPIVCVPAEFRSSIRIPPDEIESFVSDFLKGRKDIRIKPIPRRFPSDRKLAFKIVERVAFVWGSLDFLARMMPHQGNPEILRSIDSLVQSLYSFGK